MRDLAERNYILTVNQSQNYLSRVIFCDITGSRVTTPSVQDKLRNDRLIAKKALIFSSSYGWNQDNRTELRLTGSTRRVLDPLGTSSIKRFPSFWRNKDDGSHKYALHLLSSCASYVTVAISN